MSEKLLEFSHGEDNKLFRIESSAPLYGPGIRELNFSIIGEGVRHGEIRGRVEDQNGGLTFYSSHCRNFQRGNFSHVPGVVGAAISEIVSRGIVDRWESSESLLDPGRSMYERLRRMPQLTVVGIGTGSGQERFIVTRDGFY